MSKTTVVVPCHNEARRLDLQAFTPLLTAGVSLLFVDDGSTDATPELLASFAATRDRGPPVTVLSIKTNQGKGEAVRAGLNAAIAGGAKLVGYLDADLAAPPQELLKLLDVLEADPALRAALGSRVALLGKQIERRALRHYLGRLFATAAALTLDATIYDTQCGAKAFRVNDALSAALVQPFSSRWVFDVELIGRLLAHGRNGIVEVPLEHWRDVSGGALSARQMVGAGIDLARLARGRKR